MKNRTKNTYNRKYINYYCNRFDESHYGCIYSSEIYPIWNLKRIYLMYLTCNNNIK